MQKVNRVLLVGNGFNYLIAEIIARHDLSGIPPAVAANRDACVSNLLHLTKLWAKFDEAFADLKKEVTGLSEEQLIGLIHCVINFLSCLRGLSESIDVSRIQTELKALVEKFLIEKIAAIADDFREHENLAEYKSVKSYFRALPDAVSQFVKDNPSKKFNLYTTNYDGLLEVVFAKRREDGQISGFLGVDGFSLSAAENQNLLALNRRALEDDQIKFLHIHGSYKFTKSYGATCKIKGVVRNENPIMFF